jgi:hypothetical protein
MAANVNAVGTLPTASATLHDSSCGSEHEDIAEKATRDQADAAQETTEDGAVDDAKSRDHDSLGDRQHQITPDESDAYGPCRGVVFSEHEDGVVGVRGCRDRGTGGHRHCQNADHDEARSQFGLQARRTGQCWAALLNGYSQRRTRAW